MSDNRWSAIKRDDDRFGDGMIELSGFLGVTHVLTEKEAVDLAYTLACVTDRDAIEPQMLTSAEVDNLVALCERFIKNRDESAYTALTENERELSKLDILHAGIYAEFHSVQGAVTQMRDYIAELEKECDMLRELLTPEQVKVAYPGPAEWIEENEMGKITLRDMLRDSTWPDEERRCLQDAEREIKRLRGIEAVMLDGKTGSFRAWQLRLEANNAPTGSQRADWNRAMADALEADA